jgi:methyl halide transferase
VQNLLDKTYWENRYHDGLNGWDIQAASTPLVAYFDQLDDKAMSIIIPGCGYAYEAKYLADHGFTDITIIDIALPAIKKAQELLMKTNVNILQRDVFLHEGSYDLVVEQTMFCALDPSMRNDYLAKVASWLSPKGKYCGLLFSIEFEKQGPPFGGTLEQYMPMFSRYFSNIEMEECYNSIPPRAGTELFFKASNH